MNELIKVNCQGERQTTSARTLWDFLDKPYDQFTKWFDKYKEYGFTKNEDYRELSIKILTSNGAEHDAVDYEITIEMAKELCMLQKSEKGKQARQYFIELEKRWNTPELVMARALKLADSKIIKLQKQNDDLQLESAVQNQIIHELRPKATYYDVVLQNKSLLSVSQIAKDYGMSAKALNAKLHELGIQFKQGKTWLLYQKYADKGYTQSKTHIIDADRSALNTYWTQKGRLFIYDLMKQQEILPLIEREGLRLISNG